jgi:hypothetical protein
MFTSHLLDSAWSPLKVALLESLYPTPVVFGAHLEQTIQVSAADGSKKNRWHSALFLTIYVTRAICCPVLCLNFSIFKEGMILLFHGILMRIKWDSLEMQCQAVINWNKCQQLLLYSYIFYTFYSVIFIFHIYLSCPSHPFPLVFH